MTGPMYEKARFPYLLSLMRGTVMRPASAERRERKVDRLREDQRSKQEQMNLCYDSTGWKSCTQSELGLAEI